jgi:uncharacterized membrane protein YkoI
MKQAMTFSIISIALGLALSSSLATAADAPERALKVQAKVAEPDARATALARVPGGAVQSSNLERENGRLVWSFDIADPKSPNVIEVQVDAKTGRIVSAKIETPADQAKEAKADKALKR